MVVPLVPIIAGVSFGLQSIYNVGKARDTRRYWADYYRNTGFRPRYSYRSGMYDWMKNDAYLVAGMTRFGRKSSSRRITNRNTYNYYYS